MDERVNILVEAFRRTTQKSVTLEGIIIVIVLFSLIALSLFIGYKLKLYLEEKRLKDIFIDYAKNLNLTEDEAELLWSTAKELNRDPYLALEIKQTFEKIIDHYVRNNPDFDEEKIRKIRKKLGFDYVPPFVPLTSTKDIELYQTATLSSKQGRFNVALVDKDELFSYWAVLDPIPVRIQKGEKVSISFLRPDDAIYTFEEEVEDIFKDKGRTVIKLPHTFNLIRTQRRKEVRIKEQLPVEIHVEDEVIQAYTEDISIGGLKFCLKKAENGISNKLSVGKYIYLRLKVQNKLIIAEGKIRNMLEKEDKVCFGVEFINLDKEYEEFLNDYISQKQLQLIKEYKKQKG